MVTDQNSFSLVFNLENPSRDHCLWKNDANEIGQAVWKMVKSGLIIHSITEDVIDHFNKYCKFVQSCRLGLEEVKIE